MRSITDWLLLASVHHEPVPSQVIAVGSCAHVTRPGATPRGTPNGERGSNREGRSKLAAATEKANCRRVIPILEMLLIYKEFRVTAQFNSQPERAPIERTSRLVYASGTFRLIHFVTTLEGKPQRVLEFSTSVRLGTHDSWLGARRSVLERNRVLQGSSRLAAGVQELRTCRRVHRAESYPATGPPEIGVIEQIEGIHPELRLNPLGYLE